MEVQIRPNPSLVITSRRKAQSTISNALVIELQEDGIPLEVMKLRGLGPTESCREDNTHE
jgi:hypothetical protein